MLHYINFIKRLNMKTFFNGLSIIIPTALILYILIWIIKSTELLFKPLIILVVPENYYIAGMGFFSGIMLVFFVGLLLKLWIIQKLKDYFEELISKTPIFSTIYGGIKDSFNFFSSLKKDKDDRVVLVDIPAINAKMIGFVTIKDFKNFHNLKMDEPVLVYLQMSYQAGGYSIFIPKEHIEPMDLSIEEAMRFVMTAGMSSTKNKKDDDDVSKEKK